MLVRAGRGSLGLRAAHPTPHPMRQGRYAPGAAPSNPDPGHPCAGPEPRPATVSMSSPTDHRVRKNYVMNFLPLGIPRAAPRAGAAPSSARTTPNCAHMRVGRSRGRGGAPTYGFLHTYVVLKTPIYSVLSRCGIEIDRDAESLVAATGWRLSRLAPPVSRPLFHTPISVTRLSCLQLTNCADLPPACLT